MPSCISYESNASEFIQDDFQQTASSYGEFSASPLHQYESRNQNGSNNLLTSRFQDGGSNISILSLPEPIKSSSSSPSSSTDSKRPQAGKKRKRVVLSIFEKHQVLQRLDLGEQPVVIARDFGISRQQVSDIKKKKESILSFCVDAKHLSSLRKKTLRGTQNDYHPGVEQELYRWIIRQRKLGRNVTSDILMARVADLFTQYMSNGVIGTLNRFRCSCDGTIKIQASEDQSTYSLIPCVSMKYSNTSIHNWLRHFKRAHRIRKLSADELAKLPETFTSAMDTFVIHESTKHENSFTLAISDYRDENELLTSNSAFFAPQAWSIQPNISILTESVESLRQKYSTPSPSQCDIIMRTCPHPGENIQNCMFLEADEPVPSKQASLSRAIPPRLTHTSSSANVREDVIKLYTTANRFDNPLLSSHLVSSFTTATAPSVMTRFQAISKQMEQLERTVNSKLHSLEARLTALRKSMMKSHN